MGDLFYFAFDVETTGQSKLANAMIEFSVVIVDANGNELDHFKKQLTIPNNKAWDYKTVSEFWIKNTDVLNKITCSMEPYVKVMEEFVSWLDTIQYKIISEGHDLRWISDTSGFDKSWLDYYIENYTSRPDLSHAPCKLTAYKNGSPQYEYKYCGDPIHTRSYYAGALLGFENEVNHGSKYLRTKFELKNDMGYENNHDSLSDARSIVYDYLDFIKRKRRKVVVEE
jgi:hypothetical protein